MASAKPTSNNFAPVAANRGPSGDHGFPDPTSSEGPAPTPIASSVATSNNVGPVKKKSNVKASTKSDTASRVSGRRVRYVDSDLGIHESHRSGADGGNPADGAPMSGVAGDEATRSRGSHSETGHSERSEGTEPHQVPGSAPARGSSNVPAGLLHVTAEDQVQHRQRNIIRLAWSGTLTAIHVEHQPVKQAEQLVDLLEEVQEITKTARGYDSLVAILKYHLLGAAPPVGVLGANRSEPVFLATKTLTKLLATFASPAAVARHYPRSGTSPGGNPPSSASTPSGSGSATTHSTWVPDLGELLSLTVEVLLGFGLHRCCVDPVIMSLFMALMDLFQSWPLSPGAETDSASDALLPLGQYIGQHIETFARSELGSRCVLRILKELKVGVKVRRRIIDKFVPLSLHVLGGKIDLAFLDHAQHVPKAVAMALLAPLKSRPGTPAADPQANSQSTDEAFQSRRSTSSLGEDAQDASLSSPAIPVPPSVAFVELAMSQCGLPICFRVLELADPSLRLTLTELVLRHASTLETKAEALVKWAQDKPALRNALALRDSTTGSEFIVPQSSVLETAGASKWWGDQTVSLYRAIPILCYDYEAGSCSYGLQCKGIHLTTGTFDRLRPKLGSCCWHHDGVNDREFERFTSHRYRVIGEAVEAQQAMRLSSAELAFSAGLSRLVPPTLPPGTVVHIRIQDLCRAHREKKCKKPEQCRFIHICHEAYDQALPDAVPPQGTPHSAAASGHRPAAVSSSAHSTGATDQRRRTPPPGVSQSRPYHSTDVVSYRSGHVHSSHQLASTGGSLHSLMGNTNAAVNSSFDQGHMSMTSYTPDPSDNNSGYGGSHHHHRAQSYGHGQEDIEPRVVRSYRRSDLTPDRIRSPNSWVEDPTATRRFPVVREVYEPSSAYHSTTGRGENSSLLSRAGTDREFVDQDDLSSHRSSRPSEFSATSYPRREWLSAADSGSEAVGRFSSRGGSRRGHSASGREQSAGTPCSSQPDFNDMSSHHATSRSGSAWAAATDPQSGEEGDEHQPGAHESRPMSVGEDMHIEPSAVSQVPVDGIRGGYGNIDSPINRSSNSSWNVDRDRQVHQPYYPNSFGSAPAHVREHAPRFSQNGVGAVGGPRRGTAATDSQGPAYDAAGGLGLRHDSLQYQASIETSSCTDQLSLNGFPFTTESLASAPQQGGGGFVTHVHASGGGGTATSGSMSPPSTAGDYATPPQKEPFPMAPVIPGLGPMGGKVPGAIPPLPFMGLPAQPGRPPLMTNPAFTSLLSNMVAMGANPFMLPGFSGAVPPPPPPPPPPATSAKGPSPPAVTAGAPSTGGSKAKAVGVPECKYFRLGCCSKGNSCTFLHNPQNAPTTQQK